MAELERWTAAPDIPDLLPGEDRTLGQGLFVDLVPKTCWFTNVRSCVAKKDWERLRRVIVRRAGERCEICGATADPEVKRRLEVHERWIYDEAGHVQTLKRLICLCSDCHLVTHFGLASVRRLEPQALGHLVKVTGMSMCEAKNHVDAAFEVWQERSKITWTLDLSILTTAGIALAPPPDAKTRAEVADATWRSSGRGPSAP
jgi:5-methylcytosine-specific restriction endonuclease McrA